MGINNDQNSVPEAGKSFSIMGFMRRVFKEKLDDDDDHNHKLLVIAVHAVLLESGFLEINPISNSLKDNKYNLNIFTPFQYTLPNLITTGNIQTDTIRFQKLGNYCKVYGSLVNGIVYSIILDEDKLIPFLITLGEKNQTIFEFWRKTKDGLVLPLLFDLCEKTGLEFPSCFMKLPTELKLKILDFVDGVEIAKMSCSCSEMRYLTSSEDLWKQKYVAQFGDYEGSENDRDFKERFVKAWEGRKNVRYSYDPFGWGDDFPLVRGEDRDKWLNIAQLCLLGG